MVWNLMRCVEHVDSLGWVRDVEHVVGLGFDAHVLYIGARLLLGGLLFAWAYR